MTAPRFTLAGRVPAGVAVLGVPVYADLTSPAGAGASLDQEFLVQRRFEGKPGQAQAVLADDATTEVALGVGPRDAVDAEAIRRAGAALARQAGNATTLATTLGTAGSDPELIRAAVEGIGLGTYRFDGTRKSAPRLNELAQVVVVHW